VLCAFIRAKRRALTRLPRSVHSRRKEWDHHSKPLVFPLALSPPSFRQFPRRWRRQVGLQASAIRYYERIGLLPRAPRISGQRRYDTTTFYPLAIIQRARQLGFTLTEIRHLFFAFRDITRPSERCRTLAQRKLAELDQLMDGIKAVRGVLKKMMTKCRCDTLDECGEGVFRSMDGSRSR